MSGEAPDRDLLYGIVEPFAILPLRPPELARCHCGHQRDPHPGDGPCRAHKCPCPRYREDPNSLVPELVVTMTVAGQTRRVR